MTNPFKGPLGHSGKVQRAAGAATSEPDSAFSYSGEEVRAMLEKAHALGFDAYGGELDDLTLRQVDILVHRKQ